LWTRLTFQQYIAQQREAFLAGVPPPDFPGGVGESEFSGRGAVENISSQRGRQGMGLEPFALHGDGGVVDEVRQASNRLLGF
jgi:hypothetical protein